MPALQVVKPEQPNIDANYLAWYFCENCGMKRLQWMQREIEHWIDAGFEPDMIQEAIDRTSRAPRPSWAYLNAIMNNAAAAYAYTLSRFLTMRKTNTNNRNYY